MLKLIFIILMSYSFINCSNNTKKPVLATSHPSGDICNALSTQQPINFLDTPIGGKHNLIIPIYIEKNHELHNIYASGIYSPIDFYGSGFPGVFPENTHKPCGRLLSSADEAANYCHIRIEFKPIERRAYTQELIINYKINGSLCSKAIQINAKGF